ncbi:MAG TPA: hypothetical protein VL359_16520 [bacterium]|nr:hypothetical protein [bacterium]
MWVLILVTVLQTGGQWGVPGSEALLFPSQATCQGAGADLQKLDKQGEVYSTRAECFSHAVGPGYGAAMLFLRAANTTAPAVGVSQAQVDFDALEACQVAADWLAQQKPPAGISLQGACLRRW